MNSRDLVRLRQGRLGAAMALTILLIGCASGPKVNTTESVDLGAVHVYASHVNLGYTSSFKGALNAKSIDGQDVLASRLNERIIAAGFHVIPEQEPATYRLREVFSGKAGDYVADPPKRRATVIRAAANVGLGFAACALLNTCSDAIAMSNEALSDINALSMDLNSQTSPTSVVAGSDVRMVITEVCTKRGCGRAIAVTRDPNTSINQLREINVDEGIMRAINLKR